MVPEGVRSHGSVSLDIRQSASTQRGFASKVIARANRIETCRRARNVYRKCTAFSSSAKSEMLSISLFAEMIRGDRVAINISPLCGDDSVHILQRTNRRTFEAKPRSAQCFCWFDQTRKALYLIRQHLGSPDVNRQGHVILDCAFGEKEFVCDLSITIAPGNQAQYF